MWCGYADEKAYLHAQAETVSWTAAEVRYRSADLNTVRYLQTSESGDYEVIDTYVFGDDGILLEREETRIAPFYRVTSAARIGGTRPRPLHRTKIEPKGVTATIIADGPIPRLPIKTSIESFSFLKLVTALRSNPQREVCAR